ncbi:MAG TPA: GxxExxY protein [Pyrinomonadaceae bacterium]|nr:GxxExxY protein [Pyrinomonadaceae bacterium]
MFEELLKPDEIDRLTETVIGAAIEVHREIGPGLLESAYEECLAFELSLRGLRFERQKPLPVRYKGVNLDCGYKLDLLVENELILEIKAVSSLLPIHEAQVLSYLRMMDLRVGLLLNFHATVLKNGLKRIVNKF